MRDNMSGPITNFMRRIAEDTVEREPEVAAAPVTPKQPEINEEAMKYAQDHKTEVFRSLEPTPSRFKDFAPNTEPIVPTDFLLPKELSGSNFEGGIVNQVNYDLFLDRYGLAEGVLKISGGHESYGVAILLSSLSDEIIDALKALGDYPSMDDEEVSVRENVAIKDAWFDWAHYDFQRALENKLPEKEDEIAAMPEPKLWKIFESLRSRLGAEWIIESGGSAYIEVNRIADTCTEADL